MAVTPVMIYTAGPIDDVSVEVATGWRRRAAEMTPGVLFFDPVRAWHNVSPTVAEALDVGNRTVLCASSGVLANLSGEGRGFGTIREIEFAVRMNVPVAVVTPPLASLLVYDIEQRETLEEALTALLAVIADRRQEQRSPLLRLMGLQMPEDEQ